MATKLKRWDVISQLIRAHNVSSVLEIGVLNGENAKNILKNHPKITYYGVDPYEMETPCKSYDFSSAYKKACEVFAYRNTVLVTKKSEWFFRYSKENFDLIFIDGDHSYEGVKYDIVHSMFRLKGPSILCGHDYSCHHPGVTKAVDEFFGRENIVVDSDNVWISFPDARS